MVCFIVLCKFAMQPYKGDIPILLNDERQGLLIRTLFCYVFIIDLQTVTFMQGKASKLKFCFSCVCYNLLISIILKIIMKCQKDNSFILTFISAHHKV